MTNLTFNFKSALLLATVSSLITSCGGKDVGDSSSSKNSLTPFEHQNNVFAAVDHWYVNPWWSMNAEHEGVSEVAKHSTAVWLGKIADIEEIQPGEIPNMPGLEGGQMPDEAFGLKEHLMEAEKQGNALVQLVVYNLPGRDCADVASLGELPTTDYGMEVYQKHYIDRMYKVLEQYPHIPIAAIIEPNSLYHLVINSDEVECMWADNTREFGYVNGIRYAINRLSELDNVHLYLDAGASNILGWDDDLTVTSLFYHGVLEGFSDEIQQTAKTLGEAIEADVGATGRYEDIEDVFVEAPVGSFTNVEPPGYGKIDGFITNVGDYVPLDEPALGDPRHPVGANPLRSHYFYGWNPRFDEWTFSEDWLFALQEHGADTSGLGMVIDTSRNGWGQAMAALQGLDPIQDPELVNDYRVDSREYRMNWCNQENAGLGARPKANPDGKDWIDAYAWVKSPGESDGISYGQDDPRWVADHDGPRRRFIDPMCDPDELSSPGQYDLATRDLNLGTGAMADAPRKNRWFKEGFLSLTTNAWPPVCQGEGDSCD